MTLASQVCRAALRPSASWRPSSSADPATTKRWLDHQRRQAERGVGFWQRVKELLAAAVDRSPSPTA